MAEMRIGHYDDVSYQMNTEGQGSSEIDLLELLYYLIEHLKYIITAAVLGGVIALLYTIYFITPQYSATAKLYVMSNSDSAINLSDLQIGSYLGNDYLEVFNTWEVHEMVINELGLDYTYGQLQSMVSVSNASSTRILYVTVKSPSPQEAADLANCYARVAKRYISETMSTDEPNIFSTALVPTRPVSPNKTRNTIVGFVLGMLLVVAVLFIRFMMDDRIKNSDDIAKYVGLVTLAVVPVIDAKGDAANSKRRY